MGLNIGSAGLISLLVLPAIYLGVIRLLGNSYALDDTLIRLLLAEGISLAISLVIVLNFKIKARVPLPQT